jgi:hypothetical protein
MARDAEERRAWLAEASARLDGSTRQRLACWADYLQMKAETNETHARYRGLCFLWFARVGFVPDPAPDARRFASVS